MESICNGDRLALLLLALVALEKSSKLLSNALHDMKDMLVGRLILFREELQDGLKLPLCAERKAEGSVKSMLKQESLLRFQQDWDRRANAMKRFLISFTHLEGKSLPHHQCISCSLTSERC
jgi:hypothetical protein